MTDAPKSQDATASAEERRALDADELQLADMARHPTLGQLSNRALSDLIARLRTRRNRARDIADRQQREVRAKAAPAGTTPASGNAGTLVKHDYLGAALERAVAERTARGIGGDTQPDEAGQDGGQDGDTPSQHDLALRAMALKEAGDTGPSEMTEDGGPLHPNDPDASDGKAGMADTARRGAPSGALDHAGELPSRERSRTRY